MAYTYRELLKSWENPLSQNIYEITTDMTDEELPSQVAEAMAVITTSYSWQELNRFYYQVFPRIIKNAEVIYVDNGKNFWLELFPYVEDLRSSSDNSSPFSYNAFRQYWAVLVGKKHNQSGFMINGSLNNTERFHKIVRKKGNDKYWGNLEEAFQDDEWNSIVFALGKIDPTGQYRYQNDYIFYTTAAVESLAHLLNALKGAATFVKLIQERSGQVTTKSFMY